jgi:sec-independent protein translocase protein TatA
VGLPELVIILVILLLLFGTSRLAGLGKGLGQAIRGFKHEVGPRDDQDDEPEIRGRK